MLVSISERLFLKGTKRLEAVFYPQKHRNPNISLRVLFAFLERILYNMLHKHFEINKIWDQHLHRCHVYGQDRAQNEKNAGCIKPRPLFKLVLELPM